MAPPLYRTVLLPLVLCSLAAANASAQDASLGLFAQLGLQYMVSPLDRHSAELTSLRPDDSTNTQRGIPRLVDRFAGAHVNATIGVRLGDIDLRYRLQWVERRRSALRCEGLALATQLSDGRVDDTGTPYVCSGPSSLEDPAPRSAAIHHVEGVYRHALWRSAGWTGSLLGSGGIVMASTTRDPAVQRLRIGLGAGVGGSVEWVFPSQQLAALLDLTYQAHILPAGTPFAQEAHRARARDQSVGLAAFDLHHGVTLLTGFRWILQ